ncbi:MAG: hypothetical protein HYV14_14620 [Elusimicrobia bacterium]|nr:hypothetical protein [Elusimicrobiota bacterium]
MGRVFGLKDKEIEELNSQYRDYDNAVKTGKPIIDVHLTPEQENAWKIEYEQRQINLDDEFRALAKDVEDETARQLALQDRERAERERLAREAQAERERQARKAEEERLAQERAAEAMWQERDAAAAVCGYSPVYQRSSGIFLWYSAQNELGFLRQPPPRD